MKWLTRLYHQHKAWKLNRSADQDEQRASYHLQAAQHHAEAAKTYERRAMTSRLQADTLSASLEPSLPSVRCQESFGSVFSDEYREKY